MDASLTPQGDVLRLAVAGVTLAQPASSTAAMGRLGRGERLTWAHSEPAAADEQGRRAADKAKLSMVRAPSGLELSGAAGWGACPPDTVGSAIGDRAGAVAGGVRLGWAHGGFWRCVGGWGTTGARGSSTTGSLSPLSFRSTECRRFRPNQTVVGATLLHFTLEASGVLRAMGRLQQGRQMPFG
jgi:hypothetical protein